METVSLINVAIHPKVLWNKVHHALDFFPVTTIHTTVMYTWIDKIFLSSFVFQQLAKTSKHILKSLQKVYFLYKILVKIFIENEQVCTHVSEVEGRLEWREYEE